MILVSLLRIFMTVKGLKVVRSKSTAAADIMIYDIGIMHIHIKIRNAFTLRDTHLIVDARTQLAQGKKYPVLYTAEYSFVTPSDEVTEFLSTVERSKLIIADGFVVKSFSQRLAAKSYLLLKKPKKPTAIFSSEDKAIEWLKSYI